MKSKWKYIILILNTTCYQNTKYIKNINLFYMYVDFSKKKMLDSTQIEKKIDVQYQLGRFGLKFEI